MTILSDQTVKLNITAANKPEAIKIAGNLLVNAGHVAPAYVDGMLAREETMSTFIGNGVAIPHGQFGDRALIHKSGISVAQFPQGVPWNPDDDETAYLVIGIAANEDDHLTVLSNLAEVLEDPDAAQSLAQTDDAAMIIERLSRPPEPDDDEDEDED